MRGKEFLRPRLRGARFEDGSISLEILGELAGLRELVLDIARWRFLQEHPGRQRLPPGFSTFDLRLTRIERGSAVPVIDLVPDQRFSALPALQYQRILEKARDDIFDIIDVAEYGDLSKLDERPPNRCLTHFNRIGRSLRGDEAIELLHPILNYSARLTRESRRRLVRWSSEADVAESVTLRGTVFEANQAKRTFELQPVYGPRIKGPIPEGHIETVIEAFNHYRDATKVLVKGIGRYDSQHRLYSLESVERISWLDPLDVPSRLDEFKGMKSGWMDGEGLPPDDLGLDWLAANFDRYYPDDITLPYTFPTPEGGVEMEWLLESESVILEIDLAGQLGDWLRFDRESDGEDSRTLDLSNSATWEWLVAEIRRLAEPSG